MRWPIPQHRRGVGGISSSRENRVRGLGGIPIGPRTWCTWCKIFSGTGAHYGAHTQPSAGSRHPGTGPASSTPGGSLSSRSGGERRSRTGRDEPVVHHPLDRWHQAQRPGTRYFVRDALAWSWPRRHTRRHRPGTRVRDRAGAARVERRHLDDAGDARGYGHGHGSPARAGQLGVLGCRPGAAQRIVVGGGGRTRTQPQAAVDAHGHRPGRGKRPRDGGVLLPPRPAARRPRRRPERSRGLPPQRSRRVPLRPLPLRKRA
ncbi:hypothetical protein QF027_008234 [Streptomyces canus]|nr:hypothetical protein [Streptomyces canus]